MKRFFKNLLLIFAGSISTAIVLFLIFLVLIAGLTAAEDKPFNTLPKSVYHMKLNKPINERAPITIFDILPFTKATEQTTLGLNDILKNIEKARTDNNIEGIFLELSFIQAGMATTAEIREELKKFKETGKFIIAYGDMLDKKAYYLATIADEIYLNPVGVLDFTGFRSEINFFKGTFDKLGIEPRVFRVGKYKSFGEIFDSKELSAANKEQIEQYLNGVWNQMLEEISESRGIEKSQLDKTATELGTDTPEKSFKNKMVDGLIYKDELINILKEKSRLASSQKINLVNNSQMKKIETKAPHTKDKIAVVYAWGDVILGTGQEGDIGPDRIIKALKKAREDRNVKAIVFRVNSGGGSALASEILWRELDITRKMKPVVASIGDVGASGGYYFLAPADTILASKYSLTGSIGVVAIHYNAEKFLNEKLGVTHQTVRTNKYADVGSFYRPISPVEAKSIQNMVDVIYKSFVDHVAVGRKSTYEEINKIAQGRIWLGSHALNINLIDGYGGINNAIETAAAMTNLEKYKIEELTKLKGAMESILDDTAERVRMNHVKDELGSAYYLYNEINKLLSLERYQARLLIDIEIQ